MTFKKFLRWDNPCWYIAPALMAMSGHMPCPPVVGVLSLGIAIGTCQWGS
jgi:hypothetical protein